MSQARFALTHEYAGSHPVAQQTFADFRSALAAYQADRETFRTRYPQQATGSARYPSTIRVVHPDGSLGAPFSDANPIDGYDDEDAYIAGVEAWAAAAIGEDQS